MTTVDRRCVSTPQQHGIETEVALLRQEVEQLRQTVETQTEQVKELLEAWNTATGIVSFIKWVSGLAGAAGVLYAFWQSFKHQA